MLVCELSNFVAILVFWVLPHFEISYFVTVWFFCAIWDWSQYNFFSFVTIWCLRFVTVCVFEFCHNFTFCVLVHFEYEKAPPVLTSENMSKSVLVRVYYLNLQPWYTSYELPDYVLANFWVNAKKKYLAWNSDLATMLKILMGKRWFFNGEILKIFKSRVLPEQYINMGPQYTKNHSFRFLRLQLSSIVISKI